MLARLKICLSGRVSFLVWFKSIQGQQKRSLRKGKDDDNVEAAVCVYGNRQVLSASMLGLALD